ncbi:hypothetical protein [Pseudazoarcus pumilus]|uniref:Uncharacterized protein n=1 Tax=Pseudazoarcus pumilus TaxID=2067960 RepID=A0A2I6S6U5_9RHOO|nr:hypothetical protein [Pseudazoarcus pumilus]AUN94986.1 hypothetical protein C0099_08590 [Pseudazoarcus pumilus]
MEVSRADDGTPLTLYAIESREGQPVFHVLWLDDDDRLYTSWWFFDTEPATQDDLLDLMRAARPVLRY